MHKRLLKPTLMVKKQILVIEDNDAISDVIQLVLIDEGFEVHVAVRWTPLTDSNAFPDLIILDNLLPGQLGQDICLELKINNVTAHIPVILMSAANQFSEIGIRSKADAFIAKPFNIVDLVNCVNKLLLMDGSPSTV
jgi:DNA-binding response OmpR family regulator